ncbi:MAG: hypothetical protein ABH950_01420 [Candidatus Altiarchaeota archaeon]
MKKRTARILLVVLIILLGFFVIRAFYSYKGLIEKSVTGYVHADSVRGWMTVGYVSQLYDIEEECICRQLNYSEDQCRTTRVGETFGDRRIPIEEAKKELTLTVLGCRAEQKGERIIEPWMDVALASRVFNADPKCVCENLKISSKQCLQTELVDLIPEEELKGGNETLNKIRQTFLLCSDRPPKPPRRTP